MCCHDKSQGEHGGSQTFTYTCDCGCNITVTVSCDCGKHDESEGKCCGGKK